MVNETIRLGERDKQGRFVKGSCPNPKGNNQFTSIVPLLEAIQRSNKNYKQDFWDYVVERLRHNDTVLIAILKKLIPDKSEHDLKGELNVNLTPQEKDERINRIKEYAKISTN